MRNSFFGAFMAFAILLLPSCFCHSSVMTREVYECVTVGTPIADVEAQAGQPRDIRSKGSDIQEYEYIERIRGVQARPDHFSVENIYYIDVLNGIVVGKRMVTNQTPAYNILYDTQPNYAAP